MNHLPAMVSTGYPGQYRLVSACGRRGRILPREGSTPLQGTWLAHEHVRQCELCEVAWDAAEEEGRVRQMFTSSGERRWDGPGAVIFEVEPAYRPTRGYTRSGSPKDRRLQVMLRIETAGERRFRARPR